MSDPVNHPDHYTQGSIECIDAMLETQGVQAVRDYCICNAFKYIWRHNSKNNDQDIRKAKWYIDKYLELTEQPSEQCYKIDSPNEENFFIQSPDGNTKYYFGAYPEKNKVNDD
jgi:hypothetical protein